MEDILVPLGMFAMVVLLVWIGTKAKRARTHEQAEVRKQLLDKFGSPHDLTEFLATPQGQSFMKDLESASGLSPLLRSKQKIIGTIGLGIVLVLLGCASFALMYYERGFIYAGTFLMALGIGALIASAVSYNLHKKWGIF